jgi:hypothetical protein
MRTYRFLFSIFFSLLISGTAVAQESILDKTRDLIGKATKADDLYSVRILLKKSKGKQQLTLAEQEALAESYRLLSGGFARFNHYKNSVEAYTNYLIETEQLINRTRLHQIDSIKTRQRKIETSELAEISNLEQGKQALINKRKSLTSSHDNYFLWSGFATVALLAFFVVTLMRIQRKTKETLHQLDLNRDEVLVLFRKSISARVKNGIPNYIRYFAGRVAASLEQLLNPVRNEEAARSPIGTDEFRKSLAGTQQKAASFSDNTQP